MEIEFTKEVIFKDMTGAVLKTYKPGDVIEATFDAGHYFGTAMGGIYKDEAKVYVKTRL